MTILLLKAILYPDYILARWVRRFVATLDWEQDYAAVGLYSWMASNIATYKTLDFHLRYDSFWGCLRGMSVLENIGFYLEDKLWQK